MDSHTSLCVCVCVWKGLLDQFFGTQRISDAVMSLIFRFQILERKKKRIFWCVCFFVAFLGGSGKVTNDFSWPCESGKMFTKDDWRRFEFGGPSFTYLCHITEMTYTGWTGLSRFVHFRYLGTHFWAVFNSAFPSAFLGIFRFKTFKFL